MKVKEIIGYRRDHFGKQESKRLRKNATTPCVLYGGEEQVHFYTPMSLLRELVYTPDAYFVRLNVENKEYPCILQDIQFHPVSEMILHVDFLQISESKPVKMQIPLQIEGRAPGVVEGGKLVKKLRKLAISAYPKDMPFCIKVSVSALGLGQMIRVKDLNSPNYTILATPGTPIVSVEIPRALRGAANQPEEAK